MKKIILSFLTYILVLGYAWSSNGLIVNDVTLLNEVQHEGVLGNRLIVDDVTLPLSGEAMINIQCSFDMNYLLGSPYLGYQLDVVLSDGLELVENNGKVVCENGFTGTDHSIKSQKKENNTYRFVVVSMSEEQLPSQGSLLKMYVKVKDGVSLQGQLNAKVTNARFTTQDFNEESLSDVNFHISIADDKASQSLDLSTQLIMTYGDASYALPQTTAEGLPLTWTIGNTSVATVNNYTLTIKNAGTTTITATQAGNDSYLPFSHEYTLLVGKATLNVTANNCSKQQGEDNPPLTVSYNGFKYNDNASSLTIQPTVTTTATKDSPAGTYPITVSGAASNNYEFTYVNGTLTVTAVEAPPSITVTDITHIYAEASEGLKGGDGTLTICLKNAQATNAYSFDLILPEGVTLAKDGEGEYVYTLSNRHNGHSATVNYHEATGVYSFAVLSLSSKEVKDNDGVIWTLKLNVADNVAVGDYAVKVQNAKYSLTSGSTSVILPETVSVLTVEDYVKGDANGDGVVDIADAVCIVNHVVGKETPAFVAKAADANGDGVVDIADAVRIVNLVVGKIDALARQLDPQ